MRTPLHALARLNISAMLVTGLSGCGDPCDIKMISAIKSPDGRKDAGLFEKSCGATTGFTYQIYIADLGDTSLQNGSLILHFGRNRDFSWPENRKEFAQISWRDTNILDVALRHPARIFDEEKSAKGVSVVYSYAPDTIRE
jgi:hypothetical protein